MAAVWRVLMRMGAVGGNLYFWPQVFGFGDEMQAVFRKNVWWLAPLLLLFLVLGSIAVDAELASQKLAYRKKLSDAEFRPSGKERRK